VDGTSSHRRMQELKLGTRSSAEGASRVEAPKAPREVGCGEWVSPSPQGEGSGEGAVPSSQKNFLDLKVKMAYFRGLCAKFRFFSITITVQKYSRNAKTAVEIELHAIKSVIQGRLSF